MSAGARDGRLELRSCGKYTMRYYSATWSAHISRGCLLAFIRRKREVERVGKADEANALMQTLRLRPEGCSDGEAEKRVQQMQMAAHREIDEDREREKGTSG